MMNPLFRIAAVHPLPDGGAILQVAGQLGLAFEVAADYVEQHQPAAGGYIKVDIGAVDAESALTYRAPLDQGAA